MDKEKLRELIKQLVQEYTGTGSSGGNSTDGNDITSPRPFADDAEELENYLNKNVYGGEGNHYRKDSDPFNYNRTKMFKFELKKLVKKHIEEQLSPEENQKFQDKKIQLQKQLAQVDVDMANANLKAQSVQSIQQMNATSEPLDNANKQISNVISKKRELNLQITKIKNDINNINKLKVGEEISLEDKNKSLKSFSETLKQIQDQQKATDDELVKAKEAKAQVLNQRTQITKGAAQAAAATKKQITMQKKAISQIGKAKPGQQVQEQAYGSATLTTQGQSIHRAPGVWEEDDILKEFTDYGQEGRYPKKEKPGDMFQQKEVEDMFPNGMASRSDKAFQDRVKQHADWTEQRAFNSTFVHMQYHETEGLEDDYFIYQTQHYNGNYDDFRNPKFTLLSITKNKDTENEEDLGEYIVDTNAYIKDLETLRNRGVLGDRVMELFDMKPKSTQLPISAERIKKVFDIVNGAKDPVKTPQFWKNFFRAKYGIPFPEKLKNIDKLQALAMNKFGSDMKDKIKETKLYTVKSTDGTEKQVAFADDAEAKDAVKHSNIKSVEAMEELDLTNDIGKDDYVDDEGRYAKSQLYKMAKYSVKLHQKLDDMEQLPAWLQAKLTKASDYVSMVYHYLDYEMARRDSNLMEEMDEYKKNMFEEPNEGNAFAVARLKAIKAGEDEFEVGGKKHKVTDVSDDDKKAAEDI